MNQPAIGDHAFQQYLQQEKLMGSRCRACHALFVPPRSRCSDCHHTDLEWVQMEGKGQLAAFTCIAIGPPQMVAQGFDRDHPYCSAVVRLSEGPRMVARVDGVDPRHPEGIEIGLPLKAKFLHQGSGDQLMTSLVFTPV